MNIFCIEHNYLSHKRERGLEHKEESFIFMKPGTALLPVNNDLNFVEFKDHKLFAQCEIVLRISANGDHISESEGGNFYDAITTGINFTRLNLHDELSGATVNWEDAKAWPHSSAIGEWFDASDFSNKQDINFCLYQNREMGQMSNTDLMVQDFNKIISVISSQYSLRKDDLIFTGSPYGICELFEGDKLEAFIEDDSALEFGIVSMH